MYHTEISETYPSPLNKQLLSSPLSISKQTKSIQSSSQIRSSHQQNISLIQLNLSQRINDSSNHHIITISNPLNNPSNKYHHQCSSCSAWQKWALEFEHYILTIENKMIEKQRNLQEIMQKLHKELLSPGEQYKINYQPHISQQICKKSIEEKKKQSKMTIEPIILSKTNQTHDKLLTTSPKPILNTNQIQTQQQDTNHYPHQNQNKPIRQYSITKINQHQHKNQTANSEIIPNIGTPSPTKISNYYRNNLNQLQKNQNSQYTLNQLQNISYHPNTNQSPLHQPNQTKQNIPINSIPSPIKPLNFLHLPNHSQKSINHLDKTKQIQQSNTDNQMKQPTSLPKISSKIQINFISSQSQTTNSPLQINIIKYHSISNNNQLQHDQRLAEISNTAIQTNKQQCNQLRQQIINHQPLTNIYPTQPPNPIYPLQPNSSLLAIPQQIIPSIIIKSTQCILNPNSTTSPQPQTSKQLKNKLTQQQKQILLKDKKLKHGKCLSSCCNQIENVQTKKQNICITNMSNNVGRYFGESPEQNQKLKKHAIKYEYGRKLKNIQGTQHPSMNGRVHDNSQFTTKIPNFQKIPLQQQSEQQLKKYRQMGSNKQARYFQMDSDNQIAANTNLRSTKINNRISQKMKKVNPLFISKLQTRQKSAHAHRAERKKTYKYTEQYQKQRDEIKNQIFNQQPINKIQSQQELAIQNGIQSIQIYRNQLQNQIQNQQLFSTEPNNKIRVIGSLLSKQTLLQNLYLPHQPNQINHHLQPIPQPIDQKPLNRPLFSPKLKYSRQLNIQTTYKSPNQSINTTQIHQHKYSSTQSSYDINTQKYLSPISSPINQIYNRISLQKQNKQQEQHKHHIEQPNQKIYENPTKYQISPKQHNANKKRQVIIVNESNQKINTFQLKNNACKSVGTSLPFMKQLYIEKQTDKLKSVKKKSMNIGQKNYLNDDIKDNVNENNTNNKQFKQKKILNQQQYLNTLTLNINPLDQKSRICNSQFQQTNFQNIRKKVQRNTDEEIQRQMFRTINKQTPRQTNPEIRRQYSSASNFNKRNNIITQMQKLKFQNQNLKSYNIVLLNKLANSKIKKY